MSQSPSDAQNGTTRLLRGHITNFRKTRRSQDFLFKQSDRNKMGATAIAAGLAGLSGIAVGLGGMAMDTTEEADLVEFDLDNKSIRAWVWSSVFKDGDEVEVVAEPFDGGWQGYGIRRVEDKIVALYPHCSRGRAAHRRAVFKAWGKWGSIIIFFPLIIFSLYIIFTSEHVDWFGLLFVFFGTSVLAFIMYGFIAYRVSNKLIGFVNLAEGIFTAFGWKDVKNIDLPAITKETKNSSDPGALGVLYFRY